MCGIAGLIVKDSSTLGQDLIDMLKELEHRGKDATGIAVYEDRDDIQVRVSLTDPCWKKDLEEVVAKFGVVSNSKIYKGEGKYTFYEASIAMKPEKISELNWEIDTNPNLCVHSIGRRLKVYKDQGSAVDLQRTHQIAQVKSTHGIGHVRLATESVDNINFAHPFTSYLYPELAIVHNGQFTNYFNMRRKLQNLGVRFKTNNDSEMAAHFLAYQMKNGNMGLEEALYKALDTFDGVFTVLVSTANQIGVVKDRLGIKPMLFFEQGDGLVLFGSEQICLTPKVSDVYATEMDPGGVRVWSV